MNLMKRILVLLLASMMLFAFVACDDNTPTPAPHEHEFGEWTITKEATCTEEGVKTRTCKGCSETETEAIPAKGHNPDANGKCTACGKMIVSNGSDFLKATINEGEVIISLQDDITIDIAPWPTNDKSVFGTASTTSIVVEGNGHTITFHNTDSDWNAIYTKNEDAVLTIKNATIDNSGYNADGGTWNGHDITFNCNVVLDNVTANNAIAVGMDATIRRSTISDNGGTTSAYMLWIQATCQTVSIEDCTINGKSSITNDNRAIKIADEYIDELDRKSVTLNVSGTTFSSDSKAAVLVTNTAGATINWGEGNDISGVAADKVNAVWNDSDRKDYMDRVVVNGDCSKIQEQ